jgi:hypothetical protein
MGPPLRLLAAWKRAPRRFLPHGETKALNAVHLIFTGERVRPNRALTNPPLRPEHVSVHGVEVAVIQVADLVQIKLSNNRDIDRVHVDDLDLVGLVTPEVADASCQIAGDSQQQVILNVCVWLRWWH